MKKLTVYIFSLLSVSLVSTSCETNFDNPNAPSVEDVSKSTNGLFALIVGLEFQYSVGGTSSIYTSISGSGFATGELQLLNAGNAEFAALLNGGNNIAPSNSVVTNLWTNLNLVRNNAQTVINNSSNSTTPELQNAIRAYGLFYKALAIGTMSQFWENVIVETGQNQSFVTRNEGLQIAIESLEEAISLVPGSGIPANMAAAVGTNINIRNASSALLARYNLMLGNYAEALSAANSVDLNSKSFFIYDNISQNPVFRSSLVTTNVFDVNPDFGLSGVLAPDPADERIAFHLTANASNGKGFFASDATSIPVYLPGEVILIKAEALARNNQVNQAITELNKVLTKTSADDPFGLGANLPAYSGATDQASVLLEIYKNRCIEMYMSGLKLEDSRRFQRPGPGSTGAERNRNFYPYPNAERDNNPNTPADPSV